MPPGATPPSPDGAVIEAGSTDAIVDAAGNWWTISPRFQVLVNNHLAGFTANVAEIAYVGGTIWHENTQGTWYSWTGGGWFPGSTPLSNANALILSQLTIIIKEIQNMSATLGAQLTAAETQLTTDVAALSATVTTLTTAVNALVAAFQGTTVGDVVTQSMVDAVTAADAAVVSATSGVTAEANVASGATTPPATPPGG